MSRETPVAGLPPITPAPKVAGAPASGFPKNGFRKRSLQESDVNLFNRTVIMTLSFLIASQAAAQTADMKVYAGSAEIAALIDRARSAIKPDQPIYIQPLIALAPYKANLEFRKLPVPPAVHEADAEFFYVIEGAGTVIVGGTLINPRRSNGTNLSGSSINGGVPQKVAAGDFLIIPQNTPHWFNSIEGTLVLMSLRIPRHAGE